MSQACPSHDHVAWPRSFLLPCLCSCSSPAWNSFPPHLHVLKRFSSFKAQLNATSSTPPFLIFSSGQNPSFHYCFDPLHLLHCEYTGLGFILTPQASPLGNCGSLRTGNTRLTHIRAGNKTYLRISMLLSWIYVKIIETILEGPSGVVCSKSFILKQRKLRLRLGNYMFSNPIFLENLRDWNKRLQCSINSWGPISF